MKEDEFINKFKKIVSVENDMEKIKFLEVIKEVTLRFFDEFLCGELGKYSGFIKNNEYITLINEEVRYT